ncbi:MAG: GIY-YIG nuclease family protein [Acidobacteriales bacterium]|nr:GIY-YIG nuclease family protein [Terriglobales bacterium]
MASRSRNLYIGMTNSIHVRAYQHKRGEIAGFTKRYNINRLVYSEEFQYVNNAIARETEIKKWRRAKKIALITRVNPAWADLAEHWYDELTEAMQIPRPKGRARNDK